MTPLVFENPFDLEGNWFKGNLHAHTTNSDGDLPPEDMVRHYRKHGYDFLGMTDHGKVTDVEGLSSPHFLVIPGSEISAGKGEMDQPYHLVALGIEEPIEPAEGDTAQDTIDRIRSKGGEVILAHPYWSGLSVHDLLSVEGYLGVEVFNTSCFFSIAKGHSTVHWDGLLTRGKRYWGFATDDAHWHFNEHRPNDACGAWIVVKASTLTPGDIMGAVRAGMFYASTGPRIEDLSVDEKSISVATSPVRAIHFIADMWRGESFTAQGERALTEATYRLRGEERYIRVECVDREGQTAWSQPIVRMD